MTASEFPARASTSACHSVAGPTRSTISWRDCSSSSCERYSFDAKASAGSLGVFPRGTTVNVPGASPLRVLVSIAISVGLSPPFAGARVRVTRPAEGPPVPPATVEVRFDDGRVDPRPRDVSGEPQRDRPEALGRQVSEQEHDPTVVLEPLPHPSAEQANAFALRVDGRRLRHPGARRSRSSRGDGSGA